jgi:3-oxoacyl-[acyl-carrier protein] reductase
MKLFDETVAVISGATSGIGSATARLFAREGTKLVLGYPTGAEKARTMSKMCEDFGAETLSLKVDRTCGTSQWAACLRP